MRYEIQQLFDGGYRVWLTINGTKVNIEKFWTLREAHEFGKGATR